jgi:hypothetical protein
VIAAVFSVLCMYVCFRLFVCLFVCLFVYLNTRVWMLLIYVLIDS